MKIDTIFPSFSVKENTTYYQLFLSIAALHSRKHSIFWIILFFERGLSTPPYHKYVWILFSHDFLFMHSFFCIFVFFRSLRWFKLLHSLLSLFQPQVLFNFYRKKNVKTTRFITSPPLSCLMKRKLWKLRKW